jgi:hypothetical protein
MVLPSPAHPNLVCACVQMCCPGIERPSLHTRPVFVFVFLSFLRSHLALLSPVASSHLVLSSSPWYHAIGGAAPTSAPTNSNHSRRGVSRTGTKVYIVMLILYLKFVYIIVVLPFLTVVSWSCLVLSCPVLLSCLFSRLVSSRLVSRLVSCLVSPRLVSCLVSSRVSSRLVSCLVSSCPCAATTGESDRVQRIGLLAQRSRAACCRPRPIDDLGRLCAKCQRCLCLCSVFRVRVRILVLLLAACLLWPYGPMIL